MAYEQRERDPITLEKMQENALKVEYNLLAKKSKLKSEKKSNNRREPSSSSSNNYKIDSLMRTMEKIMDRISITDRAPLGENQTGQIRNPNYKINQP